MEKLRRIYKRLLGVILTLVIVAGVAAVAFKVYVGDFYKADREIINQFEKEYGSNVQLFQNNDLMVFVPEVDSIKAILVYYPGGKVEFKAYSGLMYELADRGFLCMIPRMPENLAFLKVNAADIIKKNYPNETGSYADYPWYLAGHSLGGVAASKFLYDHLDDGNYAGIILCASYTTSDFSNSDIRLLSIYGSEDKVLNMENYEANKVNWPSDSEEYVIQGGIHSYFGNYGIQEGDGVPAITNEQQIIEAADVISSFCSL